MFLLKRASVDKSDAERLAHKLDVAGESLSSKKLRLISGE
jgi:hypothetical protein